MIGAMRATRAVIHLRNFRHNLGALRSHAGGVPMCQAVKANAYGHGLLQMANAAVIEGVEYLAVAIVDEAVALREGGIEKPILLYSLPIPQEFATVVHHRIEPTVGDLELAKGLEEEARRQGRRLSLHLKIDTGMGRIGCLPRDANEIAEYIARSPHLTLAGVSTHFASSDSADGAFTEEQLRTFSRALSALRERGIRVPIVHAANSGAILHHASGHYDLVRPGVSSYGYHPDPQFSGPVDLRPVMELQSQVVFIKKIDAGTPISYGMTWRSKGETHIGTIPVGYGDGYSRLLSNRGEVWIGNERYPIVGRVCMDQTMVDLGTRCTVERYATATLFGPQEGAPDADEIASLCGTISYEITCAIANRVPRIYVDADTSVVKP